MKIYGNPWESVEIHENPRKFVEIYENLAKSMEIHEIHDLVWDIFVSEKEDGLYFIF